MVARWTRAKAPPSHFLHTWSTSHASRARRRRTLLRCLDPPPSATSGVFTPVENPSEFSGCISVRFRCAWYPWYCTKVLYKAAKSQHLNNPSLGIPSLSRHQPVVPGNTRKCRVAETLLAVVRIFTYGSSDFCFDLRCSSRWTLSGRNGVSPFDLRFTGDPIVAGIPGASAGFHHDGCDIETGSRGLRAVSQQAIPVVYDSIRIDSRVPRNQIGRIACSCAQKAAPDVSPAWRQAAWPANQTQIVPGNTKKCLGYC